MTTYVEIIDLPNSWEQMVLFESFSHWGMIETERTKPNPLRPFDPVFNIPESMRLGKFVVSIGAK